jgi:MFS family permease
LRHPGYRAYFITSALAMMADSIEHVISYWIVFEKFHSPALGGVAILTHWLPFLLFSVYAGALADRFDLRRLVQAGMALFMLVSLGWGLLFMTDSLQTWHAVVLLSLHGIAGVIWTPAAQLLIHDIVGHDELQSAVRLSSSIRYLGMLLGPAVGGGLMLVLSPAWAIIVNVLIYLPLVIWCARVSYGRHGAGGAAQNKTPSAPHLGAGFWRNLQTGVRNLLDLTRQIAHQHTIVSMTLLAGAASLFIGNAYQAQMPEYAHDLGHLDTQSYSLLMAADAVGALIGAVVL